VSKAKDVIGTAWLHQGDVKYRLATKPINCKVRGPEFTVQRTTGRTGENVNICSPQILVRV